MCLGFFYSHCASLFYCNQIVVIGDHRLAWYAILFYINCKVNNSNYLPVIIIIHNKYIFFANNKICKA